MKMKNAWNKDYEKVLYDRKVRDGNGDIIIKKAARVERLHNGLKRDYGDYRKWERAISRVKPVESQDDDSNNKATNGKNR